MRWGWHRQLDGHEFAQAPGDGEGQGRLTCCSPWESPKSDMTGQLNNKNKFSNLPRNQASQVALVVKNPPANSGDIRDVGLIPGLGGSPGEGNGNPLQYSCLENPMARSLVGYGPQGRKESDTTEETSHAHQGRRTSRPRTWQ